MLLSKIFSSTCTLLLLCLLSKVFFSTYTLRFYYYTNYLAEFSVRSYTFSSITATLVTSQNFLFDLCTTFVFTHNLAKSSVRFVHYCYYYNYYLAVFSVRLLRFFYYCYTYYLAKASVWLVHFFQVVQYINNNWSHNVKLYLSWCCKW